VIHAESDESRLHMTAVTVHYEKAALGRGGGGGGGRSARLEDALEPVVCECIVRPTGV